MTNQALGSLVQWVVWGVVMAAAMSWIARSGKRARLVSAVGTLVYPKAILVVGVVSVVVWFGIAVISNTIGRNGTTSIWTTTVFCALGIASSPLIIAYFFSRHRVSDGGMVHGGMFERRRQFAWSGVDRLTYSQAVGWFRIKLKSGDVVHVSAMLMGLPELARFALAHIPNDRIEADARALLEDARTGELPALMGRQ